MQNEKNSIVLTAWPFQKLCLEDKFRMSTRVIDQRQELTTYLGLPSHTKASEHAKEKWLGKNTHGASFLHLELRKG